MGWAGDLAEFLGKSYAQLNTPRSVILSAARDFVCSTASQYPDKFYGQPGIIGRYKRGYFSQLCFDELPPPPPPKNECLRNAMLWGTGRAGYKNTAQGRQCGDPVYWRSSPVSTELNVTFNQPFVNGGKWQVAYKDGTVANCAPASQAIYEAELFGSGSGTTNFVAYSPVCTSAPVGDGDQFVTTKITYSADVPDYCHQGGEYPPSTLPPTITGDRTVNYNDHSQTHNFTIVTNNNDIDFPLVVNVDDLIDITFDFGGWSLDGDIDLVNPGGGNSGGGDSGGGGGGGSSDSQDKDPFVQDDFTRRFPTANDQGEDAPDGVPAPVGEEFEVIDQFIKYLLVTVTVPPTKNKTIMFPDEEDNTFFAGYFSWLLEANGLKWRSEEYAIRKTRQYFKAPTEAVGYRLYAVNGAILSNEYYSIKQTTGG